MVLKYFQHKPFTLLFITHDYTIIHEIYKQYRQFLPFIEFQELYRSQNTKSALRKFSAEEYLNWEQEITMMVQDQNKKQPILTMHTSLSVFNKTLQIYKDSEHEQPVDFTIRSGELTYLKAPSGTGKTTIAKILMGLIPADKFSAQLGQLTLTENTIPIVWNKKVWGRYASMVFQHADESLNAKANIFQTFSGLPLKQKLTPEKLAALLDPIFNEKVDIKFLNRKVGLLSGGQKQRINIMRSLLLDTPLVILDEPLNGLDFTSIKKILNIIENKLNQGTAFLIISHNEDIFDRLTPTQNIFYLDSKY